MKHFYYGWVMVLIAVIILAMEAILSYSFGIFLISLTKEFNWERGALSASLSINLLVAGILALLTGSLSDKYGPRLILTVNGLLVGAVFLLMSQISSLWQVYLVWGLLMGVAGSCAGIPLVSSIPRWFVQKRGVAMGLTLAGFGLGGIIAPPLAQWLISGYGWRQAYIILGLITSIIITSLAQFMKHSPQRIGLKPYGENEAIEDEQLLASDAGGLSFKQTIRTRRFWLLGSILACFFFSVQVIVVHIAAYAVDIEIPATVAASILSIIAGGSTIGRLSLGFIIDWIGGRRALVACLAMITLALIWLLFSREVWMLCLFAALFGFAWGGIVPSVNLIIAESFGLKCLGMILAELWLLGTAGGALGAPLAGYIFDVTRKYNLAFSICVILCTLALFLSLILLRSKSKGGTAVTK